MAEAPDPLFVRFRELIEEYKALATTECNATKATSERVDKWLTGYLEVLDGWSAKEAAGAPLPRDHATMVVMTQLQAYTLIERATWLDAPIKSRLETITAWPAFVDRGPYRYTADFGTQHQAQWKKDLAELAGRPNLNVLEVGLHEGMSTMWFLDNLCTDPSARIVCVDPFEPPRREDNYPYARRADSPSPEAMFDRNVAAAPRGKQVTTHKTYSGLALRALPLDSFDFAYIDGSHLAPDVLEDAVLVWRLVKVGGFICFDDYGWELPADPLERPRPALDAFMSIFARKFEVVHKAWQLTLRKLAN